MKFTVKRCVGLCAAMMLAVHFASAETNLVSNPGFEEATLAPWVMCETGTPIATISDKEAHSGKKSLLIPAHSAIRQTVGDVKAGAYLARCWVKSEEEQSVTFFLYDTNRPWAAYTCGELKVPKAQWTQLEVFCPFETDGRATLMLGGFSKEFRSYHGNEQELKSPILVDEFELVRCEKTTGAVSVWNVAKAPASFDDWNSKSQWTLAAAEISETPVFQSRHLAGWIDKENASLVISVIGQNSLKKRVVIVPEPAFKAASCKVVQDNGKTGICIQNSERSYTAWLSPMGIITVDPKNVASFSLKECQMRYGILPSFVGSDLCYNPSKLNNFKHVLIPSSQWFVGLVDGFDCMLVATWPSDQQQAALDLEKNLIQSLSIRTDKAGFSVSILEHSNLWHQQALQEDWLAEYTPLAWERPFQARWMGEFFASPGGNASFQKPYNDYSFPIANAKTRMWGVWFEDWNHYPFFFDGNRLIAHFEKTFIPKGDALFYFLEPAAADLYSPCEIVEQTLGAEKAAALFDMDANRLRRLKYSTPANFYLDRPVCATTRYLSQIPGADRPVLGVQYATHLYEFIREIRGRVDQYNGFFGNARAFLKTQADGKPELKNYIADLDSLAAQAQEKIEEIDKTQLPTVAKKIEEMKKRIMNNRNDGFNCADLDVRDTAGDQDDACRRCNRIVLRMLQTAAAQCGDSAEKAAIVNYLWSESRKVLREPTRWESRRTLYFFEP